MTTHHAPDVPIDGPPVGPGDAEDAPPSYLLHYIRTREGLALDEVAAELRLRRAALEGNYDQVPLTSALAALREVPAMYAILRDLERLLIETCMDDRHGSWVVVAQQGYNATREVAHSRYRKAGGTSTWQGGRRRKFSGVCACGHVDDDHASRRRGRCTHVDDTDAECLCEKFAPTELGEE